MCCYLTVVELTVMLSDAGGTEGVFLADTGGTDGFVS